MRYVYALLALCALLQAGPAVYATEATGGIDPASVAMSQPDAARGNVIVFVCLHGSVKSQMAAAHFNRIARQLGLPYTAISRGLKVDASIPTAIRQGLNQDGLMPLDDIPQELTATEAARAATLVAFDIVPDEKRGNAEVSYWSDVPAATRDYDAARSAILRHIDGLLPSLAGVARSRQILKGVVTSVDERSDRIAVRLGAGGATEFKVQDGLIFDSLRSGDPVEITVENIDGSTTVVAVKKK
jgi:protein-tyrosine-phosphatase